MDRAKFFAGVRPMFGGHLAPAQVLGMEVDIDAAETRKTPLTHLAYMLATEFHETAATMQPIHERGAVSYFYKYEPGTRIGRRLGNTQKGDGYRFRGRGKVQTTGRRNYDLTARMLNIDCVNHPDLLLELVNSVEAMFWGMADGWYTGKKLSDYLTDHETDYRNARRIINGVDAAAKIAGHAIAFEAALQHAGYGVGTVITNG